MPRFYGASFGAPSAAIPAVQAIARIVYSGQPGEARCPSGLCLRESDELVPFRRLFSSARVFTLVRTAPAARRACLPLRSLPWPLRRPRLKR